mmetsp:Transcript_22607/g.58882  ORF Transcript_22607/g.58882 Transcript_22607/m.58882 type:complete len:467 (+) Transcript_22607:111-1511(+)
MMVLGVLVASWCARGLAFAPAAAAASARGAPLAAQVRKVGIVGGGTVGGGIVEILERRREQLVAATGGSSLEVKAVVVRDAAKARDWTAPPGCVVTEDLEAVLGDDDVDLVVEVMGGTTLAKDVVFRALRAGKDVVTANKALIADCLPEIEAVVAEANAAQGAGAPRVQFGYEAAVCGGIPIIHTMNTDFVGDEVTRLRGIMNGCTNFMLTKMEAEGLSYADCLAEATALGYAEEDPTLDVGGFDARSKLAILVRLAFGVDVDETLISCTGIAGLETIDFEYARGQLDGTIKLLGVAELDGAGGLTAYVTPALVPRGATLASISDATNAVEVASRNLEASLFVGRGAGRFPTANSCVSDVVACARGALPEPFAKKVGGVAFRSDFESFFYIRIRYRNAIGIVKALGEICARHDVSIDSLLQKPHSDYFVVVTEAGPRSRVEKVAADVEAEAWCVGDVFFMPVATQE